MLQGSAYLFNLAGQTSPLDSMLRPVDVNGVNKMAGEWYHIP